MPQKKLPAIGITMGDPSGIGPEVIAKSLSNPSLKKLGLYLIIGDYSIYKKYCPKLIKNISFVDLKNSPISKTKPGVSTAKSAQASIEYIDIALELLKNKNISGLVTGPVSKEAIRSLGYDFPGHTEYIADFFRVKNYGMMFIANNMKAIVATRHIPLSQVPEKLTRKNIEQAINLAGDALKIYYKIKKPSIAVCGLNPHAGENGKIGNDEAKKIVPAIKKANKRNIKVSGPFPADTIFFPKIAENYDAIVAMYHDQGLIGLKSLYFDRLVNMTVGLPFVRTSPAHGTAFNIAGKNKADPTSMLEAIKLAATLSK